MLRVLANIQRQFSSRAHRIQQTPSLVLCHFISFIYLFGFIPIPSRGAPGPHELCEGPGEQPGGKASLAVTVGTHPSSVQSLAGSRTRHE